MPHIFFERLEATQSQHVRQLVEVKHEVPAQSSKIVFLEISIDKLTAALAHAAFTSATQARPHQRIIRGRRRSERPSGPAAYHDIGTPRVGTSASGATTGKTVQVVWPKRMTKEHLQPMHGAIIWNYLDDEAAGEVAPRFKSGNRDDIEFMTRASALVFVDKIPQTMLLSTTSFGRSRGPPNGVAHVASSRLAGAFSTRFTAQLIRNRFGATCVSDIRRAQGRRQ